MIDYTDGKWHGWSGGECPVHPKTIIECYVEVLSKEFYGDYIQVYHKTSAAENLFNKEAVFVKVFRVLKPYVEPREWWVSCEKLFNSVGEATASYPLIEPIRVKEV